MGWRWITAGALAFLLATTMGWRLRALVAQDACLDAGGAWQDDACRHRRR